MNKSFQIIYVLTNPAMPGLVKIGKTTQQEVDGRMRQLYGTGVPVPFDCVFACQVKDAHEVEKVMHYAFGNTRINPNREFFKIEAERVIAVLKLLKVDDITAEFEEQLESEVDLADKQSAQNLKDSRRPRTDFHELGIENGSILVSKDSKLQVKVVDAKKVMLDNDLISLTEATRRLLGLADGYQIQPSPYWTFNGKTVKEIYDERYSELES